MQNSELEKFATGHKAQIRVFFQILRLTIAPDTMAVSRIARVSGRRGLIAASLRVASKPAVDPVNIVRPMSSASASFSELLQQHQQKQQRCLSTRHPTAKTSRGSMLLLETVAREALQVQMRSSVMMQQQGEHVQQAMNAAETLLKITEATSNLSATIGQSPEQAKELHKAFLKITQWCVSQTTCREMPSASSYEELLEHPLLDSVLQLSVRAHQLGLSFHMPLYKSLVLALASQPSIHSPSSWILQLAQWARSELGDLPHDFFDESLLALTQRQQFKDVITILQSMHRHLNISEINEEATKSILNNLKSSIRSMWTKQPLNFTLLEEDCREIVCLLESSILKIASSRTIAEDAGNHNLRDAIEGILQEGDEASLMDDDLYLEELLLETTELMESLELPAESDDIPLEDSSLLYTRSMELSGKDAIPDITYQIMKGKNTPLKYSKDMERHIYYQFCPRDE